MFSLTASQGWPSVAYNPIRSEYFVVFQLRSARILSGISFLVGSRIFAASFKLVTNPTLLLKTNQNKNGKLVNVPVTNARVLYNHRNRMYMSSFKFSYNNYNTDWVSQAAWNCIINLT